MANRFPNRSLWTYTQTNSGSTSSEPPQALTPRTPEPHETSPCGGRLDPEKAFAPAQYFPLGAMDCDPKALIDALYAEKNRKNFMRGYLYTCTTTSQVP